MKVTTHCVRVEASTDLRPEAVFAVVADLRMLPQWWFWREPHPDITYPKSRVLEVDSGGLAAVPGVRVVVKETASVTKIGRREIVDSCQRPYRFTCDLVEADARIRLLHNPDDQPAADGVAATDLRVSSDGERTNVVLVRESLIGGRSGRAMVMRWGHRHGRWPLARALRRILELADGGSAKA